MKKLITLTALTLLASCGKDVHKHYNLNNDEIDAKLANHEERISLLEQLPNRLRLLEDKVSDLEYSTMTRFEAVNSLISALEADISDLSNEELKLVREAITSLRIDLMKLDNDSMEILPICNSHEQVLSSKGDLYAVISTIESVSVSFLGIIDLKTLDSVKNVHLGKLSQGDYRLTDGSDITFSINEQGKIVNCSNEASL